MRKARRHAATRIAVEDIQAIQRVLKKFLGLGGPTAKQRRRVRQTIRQLRELQVDAEDCDAVIPDRLVRHVLWSLAQVPVFLMRRRSVLDETLDRR